MKHVTALIICALMGILSPAAQALPLSGAPNCPVFPASSPWNQRVDRLPVARGSRTLVRTIGLNAPLHADFGAGFYDGHARGIPYAVVGSAHRRVPVTFEWASQSDQVLYPLPRRPSIQAGVTPDGDRHAVIVDRTTCRDYELYDARPLAGGLAWAAGAGVVWDLTRNKVRPAGWTSADGAGLPILPGLARYDEAARGVIDHALRFTVPQVRDTFVFPARHSVPGSNDPSLPPMGLRVRLKARVNISRLPRQARIVALALKRYGMIVADQGSPPWHVGGAPNDGWDNGALDTLGRLKGRDFEVVNTSSLPQS